MKTCRFCGEKFTPSKQEPNIEPENLTHAVCQVVGGMIFEDVCEKEYCRS